MNTVTRALSTPPALIYISRTRYTYLGRTQLPIRHFHSGAASLVTCLDGHIRFQTAQDARWISARSIPATGLLSSRGGGRPATLRDTRRAQLDGWSDSALEPVQTGTRTARVWMRSRIR